MATPKMIQRKSVSVILRGKKYEIYGLSIAGVNKLRECINQFIFNIFKQINILPELDWKVGRFHGFRRSFLGRIFGLKAAAPIQPPQSTLDFINGLITTMTQDPLTILEAASGLPHALFDSEQPDECLSLDEIAQLAETVFDLNGLGFMWTALKRWWEGLESPIPMPSPGFSAPSVPGIPDIH